MTPKLIVLFGGGGFVGRKVAQALLSAGARVRIAQRNPSTAATMAIKPLGGLGQVQFIAADITRPETLMRAVAGADAVINLVGILAGDFALVHSQGAANVADAAAKAGASAFVQVSAIGADADSPSAYGRSKAQAEMAVKTTFPAATIIRPSIIFGPEDQFLNRFANLIRMAPVVPVIGGETRFQPVFVGDVARAIAEAALDPKTHGGKTYELGGPDVLSMSEINAWIAKTIGRKKTFLPVPDLAARALAAATGFLPGAPITIDQYRMLQKDNVADPALPGFAAFGIKPVPMAAVAAEWLVTYRKHGRFGRRADGNTTA